MAHLTPLHWFSFPVQSEWNVFLSVPELTPDLVGNHGITTFRAREIFINAADPRSVQDTTTYHEIVHACLGLSVPVDEQERVLKKSDFRVWPILASMHCRWPARPRGWAALARLAQKGPK